MREPEQRQGRSCVRPEVSRTKTFGAKGVSGGQWWKQHLQYIVLNPNTVDFSTKNLTYITEVCGSLHSVYIRAILAFLP